MVKERALEAKTPVVSEETFADEEDSSRMNPKKCWTQTSSLLSSGNDLLDIEHCGIIAGANEEQNTRLLQKHQN